MKDKQLAQRIAVYVLGIFILAMGVAFAISSNLGVTSISAPPYVLSRIFGTSIGMWSIAAMTVYFVIQIIILRKSFRPIDLTQLIFTVIFGYFIDFARWILGDFMIPTYLGQLAMCLISIVLIATGIVVFMRANLVNLPPEALCKAIADKFFDGKFYKVRIAFECTLVAVGIVLSLIFLDGIYGVREGTIISAVAIGRTIPFITKILSPAFAALRI